MTRKHWRYSGVYQSTYAYIHEHVRLFCQSWKSGQCCSMINDEDTKFFGLTRALLFKIPVYLTTCCGIRTIVVLISANSLLCVGTHVLWLIGVLFWVTLVLVRLLRVNVTLVLHVSDLYAHHNMRIRAVMMIMQWFTDLPLIFNSSSTILVHKHDFWKIC